MNQDNYPRSDWYAAPRAAAPGAAGAKPQPVGKRRGARIAGICVCAVLVLLGGVAAFSDSLGLFPSVRKTETDGEKRITIEFPGGGEDADELPDSYDKDYRDFFSKYYSGRAVEGHEASAVQRAEVATDLRLTLESTAGARERTLQELYPECLQSIVTVRALVSGKPGYYLGSGIVMSEDGYILTNQHLVAGTDTAYVVLQDDTEYPALLVGEDANTDLCVLKIDASGLHPAVFGDSDELTVGDSVFAIGNPIEMALRGTLTSGIVSGIKKNCLIARRQQLRQAHDADPDHHPDQSGQLRRRALQSIRSGRRHHQYEDRQPLRRGAGGGALLRHPQYHGQDRDGPAA